MKNLLLSPKLFLILQFISLISIFFAFQGVSADSPSLLSITIITTSLILTAFGFYIILKIPQNTRAIDYLPRGYQIIPVIIIAVSLAEYLTLGVPAFNQVSYHIFGYPFLHHITVSSWILLFCVNDKYSNAANITLIIFAFLNPILMVNRDLFLLTIYCALAISLLNKKLNWKYIVPIILVVIILFGYIGEIRSPTGIKDMVLPFSFNRFTTYSPLVWFVNYFSGPMFNLHATMNSPHFYSDTPEIASWWREFGALGIVFFYVIVFSLNFLAYILSFRFISFFPIFVYLNYQSIMTLFAKKYFRTNTLFVVIFVFAIYLITNLFTTERRAHRIPSQ